MRTAGIEAIPGGRPNDSAITAKIAGERIISIIVRTRRCFGVRYSPECVPGADGDAMFAVPPVAT
jgi:hypothetical protein